MSGLSSSSSFSVSADDLSSSGGADAVVLTAENAAEYGLSPRYATLKEETEAGRGDGAGRAQGLTDALSPSL